MTANRNPVLLKPGLADARRVCKNSDAPSYKLAQNRRGDSLTFPISALSRDIEAGADFFAQVSAVREASAEVRLQGRASDLLRHRFDVQIGDLAPDLGAYPV